jgi:ubiquinone biosynthesis protein COQ4
MYEVELYEQIMDGLTQVWIREKRATTLFDIEWEQILGNTFRTF